MVHIIDSPQARHMRGLVVATYEITYRLPDYLDLLNTFTHQREDFAPGFPNLLKFLTWWEKHIEGPLHSVRVAHARLIDERELRHVKGEFWLN